MPVIDGVPKKGYFLKVWQVSYKAQKPRDVD
jgi:hypothetical protein